jgi:hypothetical protein
MIYAESSGGLLQLAFFIAFYNYKSNMGQVENNP